MLRHAIAAVALGLSTGACGLESSGLLSAGGPSGTSSGSPNGAGGSGNVGVGGDDAGGTAHPVDSGSGDGAMRGTGTSGDGAGAGPPGDGAAATSDADASVSPASSGAISPQDSGPTGVDATISADAGGAVLACGNQLLCAVPAQTCCVGPSSGGMGGGPPVLTCENGATCNDPNAAALHCTAAADCAAPQVCCLSQQSTPGTSQCGAQCGNGDLQLCDPNAQSTGCPGGVACRPPNGRGGRTQQLPNGVGACG
jgi:hypothetical protein